MGFERASLLFVWGADPRTAIMLEGALSPATILVLACSMWMHLPSMIHFDVAALDVNTPFPLYS